MRNYLVYDNTQPTRWEESTPVGNGRLGAAMMCGVDEEVLFLNEETVWSSHHCGVPNPNMAAKLAAIRQLFLEGKPIEGDKLALESFGDCFSRIRSYETAGTLHIGLHDNARCKNYRHELDLVKGIASVSYDKDGSHYTRECFATHVDDVIAYRVTSSNAPLNAWINFQREYTLSVESEGNTLCAVATTVFGNHKFCVKAQVITDGKVTCCDGDLYVSDTRCFTVLINIATQFRHGDAFCNAITFPALSYEDLKQRHIADFSALMSRADIALPQVDALEPLPIRERNRILKYNKPMDGGLIMLQWQFGRYLLVSSSREDTLPANLQGLWVKSLGNEWSADYHTNINLQANYWAAEMANLSDCHMALIRYMNDYLLESGKKTAEIGYHTRGCVVHHLSDIYGFTTPADGLWGIWPHGASWLSFHMWEHYLFTQDKAYLRDTAYEFIRQAAIFFLENLVEDKNGWLVYGPSTSPENRYLVQDENGKPHACYLTLSSTMDIGIIGGLFRNFLDASAILGIEDEDVAAIRAAKTKIPPFQIGKRGQLQEWTEDYEETEAGHYHISHSFALYPDCAINRSTPDLMKAMDITISGRLYGGVNAAGHGAVNVGWSMGWLMALLSRLRREEEAYSLVNEFVVNAVSPNLFDITANCFQIDGNMAFVSGVGEMLIQSHEGVIALIPAIPKVWDHGSFRGLRARGNFELDVTWEDREVRSFTVAAGSAPQAIIELPATQKHFTFRDDAGNIYTAENHKLTLRVDGSLCLSVVE